MIDPDLDQLIAPLRDRPPAPARSMDAVANTASRLRRARRRRRGLGAVGVLALVILGAVVVVDGGEGPVELDVAGPTTTERTTGPTTESTAETRPSTGGAELQIETPGTLSDGQSVTVTGVGFPAGQQIAMSMCEPGATGITSQSATDLCELNAVQYVAADAAGRIGASYQVLRIIETGNGTIDCAESPGRCVLGAAHLESNQPVATVPLTFNPLGPAPSNGQVTASETENLRDDQPIALRGVGFRPSEDVYITQCGVGEPLDALGCTTYAAAAVEVRVDEAGNFTTSFPAQRLVFRNHVPTGGFDDCAELNGGCELRVDTLLSHPVRLPVRFDLTEPRPAVPSLTIDEQQPLTLGQEVTVRGQDFQPGMSLEVRNCRFTEGETSNRTACDYLEIGFTAADTSGSFVVTLSASDDSFCAARPGRCGLAYYPGDGSPAYVRLPLAFKPIPPGR